MVCEQPLEPREPPDGVTVRFASSAADVAAYASIAGKAFTHLSMPEDLTRDAIDNPEVWLRPDCAIVLAEVDGAPVAGASVALFGPEPAGYVGWVACLDEARGAASATSSPEPSPTRPSTAARRVVTLEASQFGESTYARMGYREIYRYRLLIRFEPSETSARERSVSTPGPSQSSSAPVRPTIARINDMHGPRTSGPSPVDQSTSVASSFSPSSRFFAAQRRARLLVELGQRREVLGRMLALRAERAADVLAVHHDLAERDVRGPGRLAIAVDDRVVARPHVGRRALRVLPQVAVDELVEVEAGA